MEIEAIKNEILKIYPNWKALDDDNFYEIYESCARDLIINYCESKGYEVEGFPFQKRILGETDENYDEDYFCFWRYVKYLDVLATMHDDVLELLYFYAKTFWPNQTGTKEEYKLALLEYIRVNIYDVEF